jgi:hypothetical protein
MLTEIAKLDAVRAAGLPDAAKASSQRPQATLVTQPKIAAPCEDGPGDTAERPFGSAGTVSQPTQEWRQIGGYCLQRRWRCGCGELCRVLRKRRCY